MPLYQPSKRQDRKSTRLNSSHTVISYAVFCLKKKKILIINSFDAMSMKARKNKKKLFAELEDSLKQLLYKSTQFKYKAQTIILPEILQETENSDSSIFLLMQNHNAAKAIVIKDIDVHFNQTGVKVTGKKNNKTRIASYDICSVITYSLYNSQAKHKESKVNICEFYTQRGVY